MTRKSHSKIILSVDKETIFACVTEYDGKFVSDSDAEALLSRIEENVQDWFYENIGTVVEQEIEKHLHEIMNPSRESDGHDYH